MAKYLFIGRYTADGAKGILREGGSGRINAARQVVESVGGTVESLYWGFGKDDWYATVDLPSHAAAAAISLTIGGSGTSNVRSIPLMTAEDIDAATKLSPSFRPPGA
ncbi:MAG: GYD domain-containing protein [Candidatus Limnocylindria bacterium]